MKLVMALVIRDEADIIRDNIEFHLARGVDAVVAVDNGSIDGTRDILDEYQRAGVALVIDAPEHIRAQGEWMTKAAHIARDTLSADWVLNNDADEFWEPASGTLKQIIACHPDADMLHVPRRNMVTGYDVLDDRPWKDNLIWHIAHPVPRSPKGLTDFYSDPLPAPYFSMSLPGKVLVRTERLTKIDDGNHNAFFASPHRTAEANIEIYHFPVRSTAQFEMKIIQGAKAYEANTALPQIIGWHQRRWLRMYQNYGILAPLRDALPSNAEIKKGMQQGHFLSASLPGHTARTGDQTRAG